MSGEHLLDDSSARRGAPQGSESPFNASLDGSIVRVGELAWRIQARREQLDAHRWVQVVLCGEPRYMVLLKMARSAQAHDALRAVTWWLASPGHENGDVIEVD